MPGNGSCSYPEPSSSTYHPPTIMNSTPTLYQFSSPKAEDLEPPPSSHPIKSSGYGIHTKFIAKIRENPFSGAEGENPYVHLREFEQICSCLVITGMAQQTLKWKVFPFSLTGRAKIWCDHNRERVEGSWETLRDKFCLTFLEEVFKSNQPNS